ncbi:class III lanthionine synthetase LanKC [Streptomyces albipurpureus]|uniref:non-specific serine/threonine protein kinase n=1 Tax=Streptomyces albipurpureus TaxID=2897419 RepID=A0ABT0UTK8_9ACTN|nr:class III lanthionine synthetase LanKC [Streptomyces sp. CWNU-1]MCM2391893.1 class III lanthionine synthetase LanKC [Streptomyces sp. CWNU-1]
MLAQGDLAADPYHVDTLDRVRDHDTRWAHSDRPAPPGWRRGESGGWVHLRPGSVTLPPQGWKIHVSATADAAPTALERVWDHCVAHNLTFKFLRSRTMVELANSKQAARSASGKVVTIYPADTQELEQTLKELDPLLAGIRGPYVLSDLRWERGPLYLRYGGFSTRYCFTSDGGYTPAIGTPEGELVPDVRGTSFKVPSWVEVPAFVAAAVRRADAQPRGAFPYRVEKALHFSNSGGVYRAVEKSTGRTVLLREARPYAGVDSLGRDAVERLTGEEAVLERLAGLDCVPRVHGRIEHWEHHFLVEEFVEGEQLHEAIGRRHPLFRPTPPGPGALADYTAWALGVADRIEAAIGALHALGVVYGDLQPGNVIVRPDGGICLVDFETAFDHTPESGTDGGRVPVAPGLSTAGFTAPWARSGTAIDLYALSCLRLALFCPLTPLMRFDSAKANSLTAWASSGFPVPAGFITRLRTELAAPSSTSAPTSHPGGDGDSKDSIEADGGVLAVAGLRDAILASATPERPDRLFPGDIRQFDQQACTLSHGAAGVLHALHVSADDTDPVPAEHIDWLLSATERARWIRPGLYDGLGGIAYVLAELGRPEAAREALDRMSRIDTARCGAGLGSGLAGIGLTWLHFGHPEEAARVAAPLERALADGAGPAVNGTGLLEGWSGAALFLIELYARTGEERYAKAAEQALARDLAHCGVPPGPDGPVPTDPAGPKTSPVVQVRKGQRWLSALDGGSAGIGIALHAYVRHREDAHFAGLLDRVRAGLNAELMLAPGLMNGHAGLLYALACLDGSETARQTQLRALRLHAIRLRDRTGFALDGMLRLSTDLATGTAGVLVAVHAATRGRPQDALPLISWPPADERR